MDAVDNTPYGNDGDHCPYCGHDWKQPHYEGCERFRKCEFPPGCNKDCAPARRLCHEHFVAVSALFAPADQPGTEQDCPKHGEQVVVEAGSNPGFTGGLIYWANLACGCQVVDASADSIERVR